MRFCRVFSRSSLQRLFATTIFCKAPALQGTRLTGFVLAVTVLSNGWAGTSEFPVALSSSVRGVSPDKLGNRLVDSIRVKIAKLNGRDSHEFSHGHHIKINIDTRSVVLDERERGVAVSLNTILMMKNHYSRAFVPMLIDTEVGFCTTESLSLCTELAMTKINSALRYAEKAEVLIKNVESGHWDRSSF